MAIHALDIHVYAPELNVVIVGNRYSTGRLSAEGCESFKEVREKLFSRIRVGRYAIVTAMRDGEVVRRYSGYVDSYNELLDIKKKIADKHKGGKLVDGSVLKDATIVVKTKLIG